MTTLTAFLTSITTGTDRYYSFIGSPDANYLPTNIHDDVLLLKRITTKDIKKSVKRYDWAYGSTYYPYTKSEYDAGTLKGKPFYAMVYSNGVYKIFKCLDNNNGKPSTVSPATINRYGAVSLDDNYAWVYMYQIPINNYTKFATLDYIPLEQSNETINNLTQNTIDVIQVKNGGYGYTYCNATIMGDGFGATAIVEVSNKMVTKILVTSVGSGYTYANIVLLGDGDGASAVAVISPTGGHSSNAETELFCNALVVSTNMSEKQDYSMLPYGTTYGRYGLLKNIYYNDYLGDMQVDYIDLDNEGNNYIVERTPTITFSGGFNPLQATNGTAINASAYPYLADGNISGTVVDNNGKNYRLAPNANISGYATPVVNNAVYGAITNSVGDTNVHVLTSTTSDVGTSGLSTFTATGTTSYLAFKGDVGDTSVVSNVSVKELQTIRPLSLELITNGTFTTNVSGWTASAGATLSIVSGALRVTNGAATFGIAYQSFPTVIGMVYVVSATGVGGTGVFRMYVGTSAGNNTNLDAFSQGRYSFVATSTTSFITLFNGSSVLGVYYDFDNVSVKLAEELITNGTFDTDTSGWYAATAYGEPSVAVVSGEMQITAVSATGTMMQSFPTIVGRKYDISYDIRKISGGGGGASYGTITNSTGASDIQILGTSVTSTASTKTAAFVATATTSYIAFRNGDVGAVTGVDNVSIKLAEDLIINGTNPKNITGWTLDTNGTGSTCSASGGQFTATSSTVSNLFMYQNIPTVVGQTYTVSCKRISGIIGIYVGSSVGSTDLAGLGSVGANDVILTFVATTTSAAIQMMGGGASATATFTNISCKVGVADRSAKNRGLTLVGNLNKNPVAAGANLVAYSGFSATNYFEQPYNSQLDFGTGDFCIIGWAKSNTVTASTQTYLHLVGTNGFGISIGRATSGGVTYPLTPYVRVLSSTKTTQLLGLTAGLPAATVNVWDLICVSRTSGVVSVHVNGVLVFTDTNTGSISTIDGVLKLGTGFTVPPYEVSIALWRISATAPSADQIAYIYETERKLFEANAQCTLAGTSNAVTSLAYDDSTDILHVGTDWGRSAFKDLVRTESEVTSVGSINSLDAANRTIVTAGANAKTFQAEQNISGVLKTTHIGNVIRSIIYDTSKDSDGGAWRYRCQDTSWYNESINGFWLGQSATAIAAWQNVNAVTGAYFQNTTNGKFYKLGTSSPSITEVFRGNTREFPAVVEIIAEASRVVIYDATKVDRPMWRVIKAGSDWLINTAGGGVITSITMSQGALYVSTSTRCITQINFITDSGFIGVGAAVRKLTAPLATVFNVANVFPNFCEAANLFTLVSAVVNDIAITVLDTAPIDPATGLRTPTIAVATAGGVSVIKDDGTVVNSSQVETTVNVSITGTTLYMSNRYGVSAPYRFRELIGIASNWTPTNAMGYLPINGLGDQTLIHSTPTAVVNRNAPYGCNLNRLNKTTPNLSMRSVITNAYNSGWMVGDIRGAWLADTVTSAELITNGDFSNGYNSWSISPFGSASVTVANNEAKIKTLASNGSLIQSFATTIGKKYSIAYGIKKVNNYTATATVVMKPSTIRNFYSLNVKDQNISFRKNELIKQGSTTAQVLFHDMANGIVGIYNISGSFTANTLIEGLSSGASATTNTTNYLNIPETSFNNSNIFTNYTNTIITRQIDQPEKINIALVF